MTPEHIQLLVVTTGAVQTIITAGALFVAARQTRNLRESIEASVYLGVVERGNSLFERALDYPRTLGPLLIPTTGLEMAPNEESEYFMQRCYLLSLFNLFHVVYLQHLRGVVDDSSWARWEALIGYFFANHKEYGDFWNEVPARDSRYRAEFVSLINSVASAQ